MKEFENKQQDNISVEKKQSDKKEVLIQRINPHLNHVLFEYNTISGEIKKAVNYNIPTINWADAVSGNFNKYKKVKYNDGCVYVTALNFKNAIKHVKNRLGQNITIIISS